jgi:hypothetical protein
MIGMNRSFAILVAILAIVVAGVGYRTLHKSAPKSLVWQSFTNEEVTFEYDPSLSRGELSADDQKLNILVRLQKSAGQSSVLITLRKETGLRVAATLGRQSIIDLVSDSSSKLLPQRFPGYQKESERRFTHEGRPANEIIFTYDSPAGEGQRIRQKLHIVEKDGDTAYYLSAQTTTESWQETDNRIFKRLFESLHLK